MWSRIECDVAGGGSSSKLAKTLPQELQEFREQDQEDQISTECGLIDSKGHLIKTDSIYGQTKDI